MQPFKLNATIIRWLIMLPATIWSRNSRIFGVSNRYPLASLDSASYSKKAIIVLVNHQLLSWETWGWLSTSWVYHLYIGHVTQLWLITLDDGQQQLEMTMFDGLQHHLVRLPVAPNRSPNGIGNSQRFIRRTSAELCGHPFFSDRKLGRSSGHHLPSAQVGAPQLTSEAMMGLSSLAISSHHHAITGLINHHESLWTRS